VRAALLALCLAGCVTRAEFASRLERAAVADNLPKVLSCWETSFEASGFRGEYVAVVDFTVGGDGKLRDVEVRELRDTSVAEGNRADDEPFVACLGSALADSTLGPAGLEPGSDVRVTGYRILFSDASKEARAEASADAPSMLIGPRADRCKGLYAHEPPRDAAALAGELAEAQTEAQRASADRGKLARALQRSYDVALELRERLQRDAKRKGPDGSRERILAELERVDATAAELGTRIGCTPPDG
jgi:hypothetical protein